MEILFVTIMTLGIAYAIYKLFELYACRKERMAMIEKMSVGSGVITPPNFTNLFPPPIPTSWAFRLGLLLAGLGLGLGLAIILNYGMGLKFPEKENLYIASMLLFGGLGLVISYLIEQKNRKKD
jgi:hypothetical protein